MIASGHAYVSDESSAVTPSKDGVQNSKTQALESSILDTGSKRHESTDSPARHDNNGNDNTTQDSRRKQIEKIKIRLEDSGAAGGTEVMKEYRETEERDLFLAKELEDLAHAKKELLMLVADLDTRIDYEFKSGILKINTEFQKYFSLMFGGGKAEHTDARLQMVERQPPAAVGTLRGGAGPDSEQRRAGRGRGVVDPAPLAARQATDADAAPAVSRVAPQQRQRVRGVAMRDLVQQRLSRQRNPVGAVAAHRHRFSGRRAPRPRPVGSACRSTGPDLGPWFARR